MNERQQLCTQFLEGVDSKVLNDIMTKEKGIHRSILSHIEQWYRNNPHLWEKKDDK